MKNNFTAIDLFAGIGGIRLGLEQAGFDVIYSNDIDKYCRQTYDANFSSKLDCRDISSTPSKEIPSHNLLAAGFPCQPFSIAGHKRGFSDPRGHLFYEVARILRDKSPEAFLLENVGHLRNHNKGETLEAILRMLRDELGYTVQYKILNTKDYGLPQKRSRIYFVGFKKDQSFSFPPPLEGIKCKVGDFLETKKTDEHYFLSQKYYEGLSRHKERHRSKGQGFGFEVLDRNGISNALVAGNMGRERNLIQDIPRENFYKEGEDKAVKRNSYGIRKLTVREYARLQGFPDNFSFPVSMTQAYKQIGNSVSVPVIRLIAQNIRKSLLLQKDSFSDKRGDYQSSRGYIWT